MADKLTESEYQYYKNKKYQDYTFKEYDRRKAVREYEETKRLKNEFKKDSNFGQVTTFMVAGNKYGKPRLFQKFFR